MEPTAEDRPRLELVLDVGSDALDENDVRWLSQVSRLHQEVRREADEFRREVTPVEGGKGGIEQIILAFGTAGVFTAVVDIVKAWISQDKTRTAVFRVKEGDQEKVIEITADGVDKETFDALVRAKLGLPERDE